MRLTSHLRLPHVKVILLGGLVGLLSGTGFGQVVINELVASNVTTLADEDGDHPDWIEIYNSGGDAVDLGGWLLSDQPDTPDRWVFPEGVVIAPGGYLVVWASGKDRAVADRQLHTNFSISSSGEPLTLSNASGVVVDLVPAVELRGDISYGRSGENPSEWRYFDEPSPGSANTGFGFSGIAGRPEFSHEAGFYEDEFELWISHGEPDATIYYSFDGTEPGPDTVGGSVFPFKTQYPSGADGVLGDLYEATKESFLYDEPILVRDRSDEESQLAKISTTGARPMSEYAPLTNIRRVVAIRARAFVADLLPSDIVTRTYIIEPENGQLRLIPVVSVVTDPEGLMSYDQGIHVAGRLHDQAWQANPNISADGLRTRAQFSQSGSDWERNAHFEFFPDGFRAGVAQDVGIRVHGNTSRAIEQKSLRVYARARYGEDKIRYPIFEDHPNPAVRKPAQEFGTLLLANGGSTFIGARIREPLLHRMAAPLGLDFSNFRLANKFVNGDYWGLTLIRERIDSAYFESNYGIDADHLAILRRNGLVQHGPSEERDRYNEMNDFVSTNSLVEPENLEWIAQRVDIDNYLRYMAFLIYSGNNDWPSNNIDFWRANDPRLMAPWNDGRWRWALWDLDAAYISSAKNDLVRIKAYEDIDFRAYSVLLFFGLLENPQMRFHFINEVADILNGVGRVSHVRSLWEPMFLEHAPHEPLHLARWRRGNPTVYQAPINFATQRPGHLRSHVIDFFELDGLCEVSLQVGGSGAGEIQVNSILVNERTPGLEDPAVPYPWTGTYFQGVPVTLRAVPDEGQRFVGWLEYPDAEGVELVIDPAGDVTATALFEVIPERELPRELHGWDFESEDFAAVSSGMLEGGMLEWVAGGAGEVLRNSAAQGFESAHLRVNFPLESELVFRMPTLGFQPMELNYLARRSGQGAGLHELSYTVDGAEWTVLGEVELFNSDPQEVSHDLSGLAEAADREEFAIRFRFSQGDGGVAGNQRFDDLSLTGLTLEGTNLAPEVVGEPEFSGALVAARDEVEVDLLSLFSDPDGDELEFSVELATPGLISAEISDGRLLLNGLAAGNAAWIVRADDGAGGVAELGMEGLVYPAPQVVADSDYLFREWSSQEPAGSFPPGIVFLQGVGNNDVSLETELSYGYHIPADDAASAEDVASPYAATSRTRVSGLGGGGVSFINTGRGRDVGGALLALDTRGVERVELGWVAGTVVRNSRPYALRLQARIGPEGDFEDLMMEGAAVEYPANATDGHREVFGPLAQPEEWLGHGNVQLLWRYHLTDAAAGGPRAELSLDDVVVTAGGARTYESWRLREFPGLGERDVEELSGPLAGGREPNLLRYALGAARGDSLRDFLPRTSADGRLRTGFDPSRGDVDFRVTRSTDLVDWSDVWFDAKRDEWEEMWSDGWLELEVEEGFYRVEVGRSAE